MATGSFWITDDPAKPYGLFDPNAELVFPIDVTEWLAGMGATYGSHSVLADAPLRVVSAGVHSAGVIPVRMALVASPVFTPGTKYPFTLRLVGADGQTDDRTLWLKITSL